MKNLFVLFLLSTNILFAQKKEEAEQLVTEGVAIHDKGDYGAAIKKYEKALELDKDNLLALAEKAYSLLALNKYEEAIACCKKAIEVHPKNEDLNSVYVTYGNALDANKKSDEALKVYDEGIKLFPDYYMLHFNKGITLVQSSKYDDAILCFQKSASLNPKHASSHNALARLMNIKNKHIPALMAYCRFLVLETQTARAKENLEQVQTIMKGNVEKTGKKSVTINISPDMLADTTADGKSKENNFATTDLLLAMTAALDYDKKNKKKSDVEQFIRKFETVCSSLKESKKDNYGFFWEFYAPYFIEMNDKGLIEPFAYIVFASSADKNVSKWINSNEMEIKKYYEWSKNFEWKKPN